MELSSKRPYGLWSGLDDLLPTGRPGTEGERGDNEFFSMLYRDPLALKGILAGMTGISTGEATLLAARFPWKRFRTFCDIGCAQGAFPVRVAMTHRYPRGVGFEFSAVRPIFEDMPSRSVWTPDWASLKATISKTRCRAPTSSRTLRARRSTGSSAPSARR